VPGECQWSTILGFKKVQDDQACLDYCKNMQGCNWHTFYPSKKVCIALDGCEEISTETCHDCLSRDRNCDSANFYCGREGICKGTFLTMVEKETVEHCSNFCKETEKCQWYTFDDSNKHCIALKDCPEVDETHTNFVSNRVSCPLKSSTDKVLTKVMVVGGAGVEKSVEVLDLDPASSSTCEQVPGIPIQSYIQAPVGGIDYRGSPLICGGYANRAYSKSCWSFVNKNWTASQPMMTKRKHAASTTVRVDGNKNILYVTGGSDGSSDLDSMEVFSSEGWKKGPSLPVTISGHCMVTLNESTLMVIGGDQEEENSAGTYFFDIPSQEWSKGPSMEEPRSYHTCSKILDKNQHKIVIIGGYSDTGAESSVIVFDPVTNEYWEGPALPKKLYRSASVEDPTGGVIVIGGNHDHGGFSSNTLYRLANLESNWVKLNVALSDGHELHTAFLIPDSVVDCN